jgi:spermidine dehydrogenase
MITRRDYLGGMLAGSGSALLSGLAPLQVLAENKTSKLPPLDPALARAFDGPAGLGDYARANGNTFEVMSRAHLIRDNHYSDLGTHSIDDGGDYDVIMVGGGPGSLGTSYRLMKETGGRIKGLILENHPIFGGMARQNEFEVNGQTIFGPQASNLVILPTQPGQVALGEDLMFEEFSDIGMPLKFDPVAWSGRGPAMDADVCSYIYMWLGPVSDNIGLFASGDNPALVRNPWINGPAGLGYSSDVERDLMRWHWELTLDRPRDGLHEWLDSMSYETLLTKVHGLSPEVARFADPMLATAIGLGSDTCSALIATYNCEMPGARLAGEPATAAMHDPANRQLVPLWQGYNIHCFPGGNTFPFRYFAKHLWPDSLRGELTPRNVLDADIRFDRLDTADSPIRVRLGATAIDVRHLPGTNGKKLRVTYEKDGRLFSAHAKSVVMSSASWVNRRVLSDAPADIRGAMDSFEYGPVVVANVALTNWRFMEKLGITAAIYPGGEFGFSCNIRHPLDIGGYAAPFDPDQPIVMTFYAPLLKPGLSAVEQASQSRHELLATPYAEFEKRILKQMNRLFAQGGFDAKRDVAGIVINRWGHAFAVPGPGFVHGLNGQPSHADVLREGYGGVAFANGELRGLQGFLGAFGEGQRAARQVLERIT